MSKGKVLCMPLKGKVVPITDVPDSVFSESGKTGKLSPGSRGTLYITTVSEPLDGSTGKRTWGSFI